MREVTLPASDNHPRLQLVVPGNGEDGATLYVYLTRQPDAWHLPAIELVELRDALERLIGGAS
jgi:hypothetical protein